MGRPGGTEAPLFGAQASLGKGRLYNQGRKRGALQGAPAGRALPLDPGWGTGAEQDAPWRG